MNRKLPLIAVFLAPFMLMGCSNIGDTNPISPEKMEQIRKSEANSRENFKPNTTPPPSSPATK